MLNFRFATQLATAGTVLAGIAACGQDTTQLLVGTLAESESLGRVFLPLGARQNDVTYTLRNAVFDIDDALNLTLTPDTLDAFMVQDLPVGNYLMTLLPGWELVRESNGITETLPEANLGSANPLGFLVQGQLTTDLLFLFDVEGTVIQLGDGRVSVGVEIVQEGAGECQGCCRLRRYRF